MTDVPAQSGLLRRVLANTGMMLGGRTVNAVVSLGYLAVTARALGVSDFGVLVLIHAFAQLIGEVAKFESWQTVLHYGAAPLGEGRRADFQRVVRFSVILDIFGGLAGVTLGSLGVLLLGRQLGLPADMDHPAALYAITIFFMAPATATGLLRLFNRFDVLSAQSVIASLVRLIGGAIGFALDAPVEFFLLIWGLGTLATCSYLIAASYLELKRRDLAAGFSWSGPLTLGMPGAWRFAWATNFSTSLDAAFTHATTLAVGALMGPSDAALWRVARQVADGFAKPAKLLAPALYPELAKLRTTQGEGAMRKLALHVGLVGGGGATVLLLATIVVGKPLLALIMGEAFASAADALVWQVAAAAIGIWALPLEPMLVSLGRPGAAMRVRLWVAVVFLAALAPVIHAFGLHGAGAALVVATLAMGVGMLISLRSADSPRGAAH